MVFLNENISFDIKSLKLNLCIELRSILDDILEPYVGKDKLEFIGDYMVKHIKNMFDSNYFVYRNMDKNLCTHLFKRVKRKGIFAVKNQNKFGRWKKRFLMLLSQ